MEYIWELFINLLGTSLFFIFANGKLDRKEIRYIYAKQTIACIIISIVLWIMNIYNMPTILTILFVLILFHYIYVEIFFSASHIEKFFWVIVFAMTSIFAEALTTIIPTQLFHIDLSEELMGELWEFHSHYFTCCSSQCLSSHYYVFHPEHLNLTS